MINPYESPAGPDQSSHVDQSPIELVSLPKPLNWGMLLVAAGLILTGVWLWGTLALNSLVPLSIVVQVYSWAIWGNQLAGCLLLVGYLLSVYVPSHYGVARYATAAAAMQLFIFSGKYAFIMNALPSDARILFLSGIPSMLIYALFLYLFTRQLPNTAATEHIHKGLVVAAMCAAFAFLVAFVTTVGDAVSQLVNPLLLNSLATQLAAGFACAYFGYRLLLVRRTLEIQGGAAES